MTVVVGSVIWIQCKVKPGPFADERLVRVDSDFGEWLGFVPIESLRDDVQEGETFVRGTITEVATDRFKVSFSGHALTQSGFAAPVARVQAFGSLEAGHSGIHS